MLCVAFDFLRFLVCFFLSGSCTYAHPAMRVDIRGKCLRKTVVLELSTEAHLCTAADGGMCALRML